MPPSAVLSLGHLLPLLLSGAYTSWFNHKQTLEDNPVLVSCQNREYRIQGSTAEELRQAMSRYGPLDEAGRPWDAATHWQVSWAYPYEQVDDKCELGPPDVQVEIITIFPHWDPPASASDELINRWNDYLEALERHEDHHHELCLEAAQEVWLALSAMEAYPTCQKLERAADATAQAVLDRYRRIDNAYDQETAHGATQGAVFP